MAANFASLWHCFCSFRGHLLSILGFDPPIFIADGVFGRHRRQKPRFCVPLGFFLSPLPGLAAWEPTFPRDCALGYVLSRLRRCQVASIQTRMDHGRKNARKGSPANVGCHLRGYRLKSPGFSGLLCGTAEACALTLPKMTVFEAGTRVTSIRKVLRWYRQCSPGRSAVTI